MAQNSKDGEMVLVNGVRYRKEDVERLGVKGKVEPLTVPFAEDKVKVTAAPGAVVVEGDDGNVLINTEKSSAGNVVVTDARSTAAEVPGGTDGAGDADAAAGKRTGAAARPQKGK